jgi:hypothetical protein
MAVLGGQTGRHDLKSLDNLGMTAAIYPSEEQLWYYGPTISTTDGDVYTITGVGNPTEDQIGPDGNQHTPPRPTSARDLQATEELQFAQLNDQTPNGAYGEQWVNLTIAGIAGWGDWQTQPYETGHSQITVANPGSEQGWGVGPARRWMHYPFSQLDNPARNAANHLRNGDLPWAYSEQNMLYYRSQLAWEQQWDKYKQRGPVTPVVPVASTVPFVQTVPSYGGGPGEYQSLLDIPGVSSSDIGVY